MNLWAAILIALLANGQSVPQAGLLFNDKGSCDAYAKQQAGMTCVPVYVEERDLNRALLRKKEG